LISEFENSDESKENITLVYLGKTLEI